MFRLPLPIRSALRRWRSTLGMVLGVGIALGIVLVLVALSQGVYELMVEDYEESGVDLYVLQQGGMLFPVLPGDDPGTLRDAGHLLAQVRKVPSVRGALGILSGQVERTREGPRRDEPAQLFGAAGVDGDPALIQDAMLMRSGRWLRRGDEVVLGSKLARDRGLGVGDTITLEHRRFRVVGIGRLRGVGLGGYGGSGFAYLDYRTLRDITRAGDAVNVVYVDAEDPASARARLLADLDSVDVVDRAGALEDIGTIAEHDMVFMRAGGALALVIAGVFVSSLLQRSVAERRAELATLRAIGVPSRTMLALVLVESLLVAAAATPVGLAIGQAIGSVVNQTYADWLDIENLYRVNLNLIAVLFGSALVLGLIAGLLPARGVLAVQPADVLREA